MFMELKGVTMNGKKVIHIKSRFRFTVFIAILIMLSVAGMNTILGMNDVSGETGKEYMQIEVVAGDTLWDIADKYMESDMDPREAVYIIKETNNLNSSTLTPGQKLKIEKTTI